MSTDYISPPKELPPGSIVWAYLRSNTASGIKQQETEIKAHCKRHNLVLGMIFVDESEHGGNPIEREVLNNLIKMSIDPANRPAGIVVWDFTRFSRNLDDAKHYRSLLRERGIILHSMNDPVPENRCRGGILETIIDIANEEIRRQNSRDVKRALRCMTKQGYSCGGKPPQGYLAEKIIIGEKRDGSPRRVSRWVPDPELWDLVKLAWQLRAKGKTYAEIRDATDGKLYNQGNSFSTFFNNKTYLGIGKCGDLEVPNHHEAAIDQETWDKVRKISKSRRQSPKNDHHKT